MVKGAGRETLYRTSGVITKAKSNPNSYLWTTHELGTAAHLYTSHGFKLLEEKESTDFGKPLREQKYELNLLPVRQPTKEDQSF